MSELFIQRPITTTLIMAGIVLFGFIGYRSLPVSDLPNVDYPTIQVTAELPGGSPETMASSVATPLERQFSTIAGLNTVSSTSTLGNTQVTLQFDLSRNIDAAAQDVQTAISASARQLPTGMPSQPTLITATVARILARVGHWATLVASKVPRPAKKKSTRPITGACKSRISR